MFQHTRELRSRVTTIIIIIPINAIAPILCSRIITNSTHSWISTGFVLIIHVRIVIRIALLLLIAIIIIIHSVTVLSHQLFHYPQLTAKRVNTGRLSTIVLIATIASSPRSYRANRKRPDGRG